MWISINVYLCAIDKISVDRVKIAVFVIQKSSVKAILSLTLANNLWHQACWQAGKLVRHWGRQQTVLLDITGSKAGSLNSRQEKKQRKEKKNRRFSLQIS